MDRVRVGAVALRLTAPASLRGADLERRAADEFLPAVLAAAERRLRARFGASAVIRVPRLDVRLRLVAGDMVSAEAIEAVGADIAEALAARAVAMAETKGQARDPKRPRHYADQVEFLALRLAAAAAGEVGPEGREDPQAIWQEAAASGEAAEVATLARARAFDRLAPVLRWLGPERRAELVVRLGPRMPQDLVRALAPAPKRRPGARPEALAAPESTEPETEVPRPASVPRETAAGSDPPAAPPHDISSPRRGKAAGSGATSRAVPAGGAPERSISPGRRIEAGQQPDPASPPVADRKTTPAPAMPDSGRETTAQTGPSREAPDELVADVDEEPLYDLESRWCPLLGLVNLSLRLELPERLWKVGLDEGAALAAMFARLAGGGDDPAVRVLTPRFPEPARPPEALPGWARDELTQGCREAAAELAGADLGPRITALAAWYGDGGWDLGAWGAALHLALAEARLGREIAPGALADVFGGAGRIVVDAETIRVIQPMEAIDIDKRLAGLDQNPGWLEWVRKRLELVFEEWTEPSWPR